MMHKSIISVKYAWLTSDHERVSDRLGLKVMLKNEKLVLFKKHQGQERRSLKNYTLRKPKGHEI